MKMLDSHTMPDELYTINGTIVCDGIISAAKSALANNIKIGLGNDVGCPYIRHYDFWRELVYFNKYVDASRLDTLHTATQVNAQIAGIDRYPHWYN